MLDRMRSALHGWSAEFTQSPNTPPVLTVPQTPTMAETNVSLEWRCLPRSYAERPLILTFRRTFAAPRSSERDRSRSPSRERSRSPRAPTRSPTPNRSSNSNPEESLRQRARQQQERRKRPRSSDSAPRDDSRPPPPRPQASRHDSSRRLTPAPSARPLTRADEARGLAFMAMAARLTTDLLTATGGDPVQAARLQRNAFQNPPRYRGKRGGQPNRPSRQRKKQKGQSPPPASDRMEE